MALWTYCILVGLALFRGNAFKPDIVYSTVSGAAGAWALHTFLLKLLLWVLGIPSSAPLLELAAYAGYVFNAACAALVAKLVAGECGAWICKEGSSACIFQGWVGSHPAQRHVTLAAFMSLCRRGGVSRCLGLRQPVHRCFPGALHEARHLPGSAPLQ